MTLILRRREIEEVIRMKDVIEAVRKAYVNHAKGKTILPGKLHLGVEKGHFRAMPAIVNKEVGIKWASVHPGNRGLHKLMATIVYNEPNTGYPLAVMDGTLITAFRTGAAAALASEELAKDSTGTVGLIGAGEQAYKQLTAIDELFDLSEVRIFDISKEAIENFKEFFSFQNFEVKEVKDAQIACQSDIVCTSTPSKKPVVKADWIKDGTHINAMGADVRGKQELEPAILKNAKIVVDDMDQACEYGEVSVPISKKQIKKSDIHATIGEILNGTKKGRTKKKEVTVFDATGMAIHDVMVAKIVYEKCKKKGLGQEIDIMS